ncbi:MAG: signal peptide peptidase SppA [Deltaproteobacteria bacterium]|nr:MAG: signal peptide peptidase SppA [Deltaproteobacteria bacterium]
MFRKIVQKIPLQKVVVLGVEGALITSRVLPLCRTLEKLERDRSVKGVVLLVDSPGGTAPASEYLYFAVRRVRKVKPVISCVIFGASGGYLAACGGEKVYALPTAIVGSIGVISFKPVLAGVMERVGVSLEVVKKGEKKDMSLFHRGYSEDERKSLEALHSAVYGRFVSIVSEERHLPREKVEEIATGELFSAETALSLGLVDAVGDLEKFVTEFASSLGVKRERVVYHRPRKHFMRRLVSSGAEALVDEFFRFFPFGGTWGK